MKENELLSTKKLFLSKGNPVFSCVPQVVLYNPVTQLSLSSYCRPKSVFVASGPIAKTCNLACAMDTSYL